MRGKAVRSPVTPQVFLESLLNLWSGRGRGRLAVATATRLEDGGPDRHPHAVHHTRSMVHNEDIRLHSKEEERASAGETGFCDTNKTSRNNTITPCGSFSR